MTRWPLAFCLVHAFVFAGLIAVSQAHFSCIHDSLPRPAVTKQTLTYPAPTAEDIQTHGTRRLAADTSFATIRILPDFSAVNITGAAANYLVTKLVPAAVSHFTSILKVRPVQGKLRIGSSDCFDVPVPISQQRDGVDADFVLYVSTDETPDGVLAWSSHCIVDQIGRPIAARVNFGPSKLDSSFAAWNDQLSTAVHEITHGLVFDAYNLLPAFVDANGNPLGQDAVIQDFRARDQVVYMVVTPVVQEVAQEQFNCATLPGAEIEGQGTEGSRFSHWERRVWGNEYMTATSVPNPIFSAVTLALFQDSGWYRANFSAAVPLPWGSRKGCAFPLSLCVDDGLPRFEEFCVENRLPGCTNDHYAIGTCAITNTYDVVPQEYRMFPLDTVGGVDYFADFCPYYFPTNDCRDPTQAPTSSQVDAYGQAYGANARCFEGTYAASSDLAQILHAGCHNTQCLNVNGTFTLQVTVGTNVVTCPPTGGKVTIPGYVGYLECPRVEKICPDAAAQIFGCPRNCSGRGTCSPRGICICNLGTAGADCSQNACPNDCSGHGTCNFGTGNCTCTEGWGRSDCGIPTGCPSGKIYDCAGVCLTDGDCQLNKLQADRCATYSLDCFLNRGYKTCKSWYDDNTCDDGRYIADSGASPNFNCPRFNCDSGACAICGIDALNPNATISAGSRGSASFFLAAAVASLAIAYGQFSA